MKTPVHVAHQFDEVAHDWLRSRLPTGTPLHRLSPDAPWAVPKGTTVLLVGNGKLRSLERQTPQWAADLAWVHVRPTGIDAAPAWLFDVPVLTISRGAAATAIAEYVLAAMLQAEIRLPDIRVIGVSDWKTRQIGTLAGRSLGLFGFGEIGQAIASRAQTFGMTVRATRRRAVSCGPGVEQVSLPELCALSDHLVLCAPLTEETRDVFDKATFSQCRPGQHFVNVARGALVVPDALREALGGPVERATLDVWPEEPPPDGHWVYTHPRVCLTPHCSSYGPSTALRLQQMLENNLTAWLEGRFDDMSGKVTREDRY
jgi:phosphoglycerate dehydrogenase-like enzyme